jgi:hypothetical protein
MHVMWQDEPVDELDEADPPVGWRTRSRLRAEPWPLLLAALILMLAFCWEYSTPTVSKVALNYYSDFFYGLVVFGLLAIGRRVQLAVAKSSAESHKIPFPQVLSRARFWPWLIVIVAATIVLVQLEAPMLAGFYVSYPWFDSLADEALADPANAQRLTGRWAGGHRIAGVEVIDRTVVFYLDRPEGNYGFARVPAARSDHILNRPQDSVHHHPAFPTDSGRGRLDPVGDRIAGEWFVVYSHYWSVKTGPS